MRSWYNFVIMLSYLTYSETHSFPHFNISETKMQFTVNINVCHQDGSYNVITWLHSWGYSSTEKWFLYFAVKKSLRNDLKKNYKSCFWFENLTLMFSDRKSSTSNLQKAYLCSHSAIFYHSLIVFTEILTKYFE